MNKLIKALLLASIAGVAMAAFIDPSHGMRAEEVIRNALVAFAAGGTTATFLDPVDSVREEELFQRLDSFETSVSRRPNASLPAPVEPFDTTPITPVETAGAPADMYE